MYDVIICGAGPAGSTAAKYLAEAGVKTLLLESSRFPKDKPCGGGLCPHIDEFPYIRENRDKFLENTCHAGFIFSPNMKWSGKFKTEKPLFYNTRRIVFDEFLARLAVASGAELVENESVLDFKFVDDAVEVKTRNNKFRCKVVIGASGATDLLAAKIAELYGVRESRRVKPGLVLMEELEVGQAFINKTYGHEHKAIIHLAGKPNCGYGWIFPKKEIVNVGYGGYESAIRRFGPKDGFRNYVEEIKRQGYLPQDLKSRKIKGCLLPLGGPAAQTYGDRALIIGDAAGFVSPMSGEGIYYAMDSGRIAADVLTRRLADDNLGASYLKEYQDIWMKRWGRGLQTQGHLSNVLIHCPNVMMKCVEKDPVLFEMIDGVFSGTNDASITKKQLIRRIARDLVVYTIFEPLRRSA